MKRFVITSPSETIANDGEPMFWNNKDGWGSLPTATVFKEKDLLTMRLPLPIDSNVVQLPE